jgi:hypothetical protein
VEVNVITAVDCVVTDFAVTIPVGLTVATLLSALLQVPPVTVEDNVTVSPSHNTADPEATETDGRSFTVTVTSSLFSQPFASIPVTSYVVVLVGLTVILGVVAPVLQL